MDLKQTVSQQLKAKVRFIIKEKDIATISIKTDYKSDISKLNQEVIKNILQVQTLIIESYK